MFVARTNILERYYNEDVRLTLPEGKRISRIKWLAIYDISSQVRLQMLIPTVLICSDNKIFICMSLYAYLCP